MQSTVARRISATCQNGLGFNNPGWGKKIFQNWGKVMENHRFSAKTNN